jgi:hypothetical protein
MLYVDIPTVEGIAALASYRGDTCVSIYLPIRPVPSRRDVTGSSLRTSPSKLSMRSAQRTATSDQRP